MEEDEKRVRGQEKEKEEDEKRVKGQEKERKWKKTKRG